jgi:hypothetical protein
MVMSQGARLGCLGLLLVLLLFALFERERQHAMQMTAGDWQTSTDPQAILHDGPRGGLGLRDLGPEHPE